MRNAFAETLDAVADQDPDLYLISGDAGFGVLDDFAQRWPSRFINAGIAEGNTIGYAAGMSLAGFNVFVYNIVPFVLYRCFEQVRNDICYQELPVTLVGIGEGLSYAPAGMTHYSVEDLALATALPNLVVLSPIDPVETRAAVKFASLCESPVYIRIGRSGEAEFRRDGCPDIRVPAVVEDGDGVAIVSHGGAFCEAYAAWQRLSADGLRPRLITVPTLQPLAHERLLSLLEGCSSVVCVEEHYTSSGLGSRIGGLLLREKIALELRILALPDRFLHDVRTQGGMRRQYGYDSLSVERAVRELWPDEGVSHAV